ncbi:MAG TPA: VTT domain-containing protein [Terracidiphilus sp.]|nr:VTT domain-containing protein [Terracidiphilus sp.]
MKSFFARIVSEWKLVVMPALIKLGFLGAGVIGMFDSAAIPVPIDAILAVYIWDDKSHFWAYPLLAAAGSAIGGLLPYWIGRGGGELYLRKRVHHTKFDELRMRFENKEFVAVLVPSMLPPPTPWKVFVFAAGVFEMRVRSFLLAVFLGRVVRWMTLAVLVLELGPEAVGLVAHHATALVGGVAALAVLAGVGWWWMRRKRLRARMRESRGEIGSE